MQTPERFEIAPAADEDSANQFYIPATATAFQRQPRTLKSGQTFAAFDSYGDILTGEGSSDGLFNNDTRYLSKLELRLGGKRPLLLSSIVQNDNTLLNVDLTNPDFYLDHHLALPRDTLHLMRSKFLWHSACYERLAIRNFGFKTYSISVSLRFDYDFADLFEVRGHARARHGQRRIEAVTRNMVAVRYTALDGVEQRIELRFDPAPATLQPNEAIFSLVLEPQQQINQFVTVTCQKLPAPEAAAPRHFLSALKDTRRTRRRATVGNAWVESSHAIFNEVLCRSMADLYILNTETPFGLYPYAGIPWFSTEFGRDGIITAMEMLWIKPEMARGVLRFLAANQATEVDPANDAEPGKILHEVRRGEMARLGEVPFGFYYGSIDSTPLFVMLAGQYLDRTGDIETIRELWPNIEAALAWMDDYGDRDGDGFVEYAPNPQGLANQGWKDSYDSIFHADGQLAAGTIALVEVQGYVFAAKREAAAMARRLFQTARAITLEREAELLRQHFEEVFWCEELSTYALALDGDKRPCRVRTSNAGHALFTGIASVERARRVADTLMDEDSFSGWGIRTVARTEARYNPMSYHDGSVWPHDNALIGLGMARYGLTPHVARLFGAVFDAASYMDLRRLPELFCGFRRYEGKGPSTYPVACSPQAWASATPFALLQACLGLEFDYRANLVRLQRPLLPLFLDQLLIRSLQLSNGSVDALLTREGSAVAVNLLNRRGESQMAVTF